MPPTSVSATAVGKAEQTTVRAIKTQRRIESPREEQRQLCNPNPFWDGMLAAGKSISFASTTKYTGWTHENRSEVQRFSSAGVALTLCRTCHAVCAKRRHYGF
jgi:hypothetical protein